MVTVTLLFYYGEWLKAVYWRVKLLLNCLCEFTPAMVVFCVRSTSRRACRAPGEAAVRRSAASRLNTRACLDVQTFANPISVRITLLQCMKEITKIKINICEPLCFHSPNIYRNMIAFGTMIKFAINNGCVRLITWSISRRSKPMVQGAIIYLVHRCDR